MRLPLALLLLMIIGGPALAAECWEDVTPAACPTGTTQRLLFKSRTYYSALVRMSELETYLCLFEKMST